MKKPCSPGTSSPEEKEFLFSGTPDRLDRFLTRALKTLSRTRIQALIKAGGVTVNGIPAPARRMLEPKARVRVRIPGFSSLPAAAAQSVPILYEDADLIVVNKPAGLVVHPAGPHRTDTLIQRLWPKLSEGWTAKGSHPDSDRPGVVHRLDRGTSGVMVIAKNPTAAEHLSRQFAERKVKKIYLALVQGIVRGPGRVRSKVGRSRQSPQRMTTESGRWSDTSYRVIKTDPLPEGPRTLLEVHPHTGRTHQIRVQLAALGHPLLGDSLYGGQPGPHPMLHALQLEFTHPRTKRAMGFTCDPPKDFSARR